MILTSYCLLSSTLQVSPIEYGHVLLIPRILDCLPQRIDRESFLLALHMAAEAGNPYFRLGYNSLGAFATINHLHFQVTTYCLAHCNLNLYLTSILTYILLLVKV